MRHKLLFTCAFIFLLGSASTQASSETTKDFRMAAALQALFAVGVRYHYGGNSPDTGFDCSGLVAHVFDRAWGVALPRSAEERVDQRVQALEGARAMIYTGESRPVRQRQFIQTPAGVISQEVTVVQETTSGFEVIPRVVGDTVQVQIAQQRVGSAAATTASGRLGEWFELGSVAMTAARDDRGIASASRSSGGETRRVWIRVDEVP